MAAAAAAVLHLAHRLRIRLAGDDEHKEKRTSRYGGYRCEKGIAGTPRLRLGRCIRTAASSALARSTSP